MITQHNFLPELYISIGQTGAMFTLRETYLHQRWFKGEGGQPQCETEVRSFHHRNLGQNKEEALAKAMDASKELGMRMTTTKSILDKKQEMREILRSTPEQMEEERRQYRIAQARRNMSWSEENDARIMSRLTEAGGIHMVGYGKYANMTYADAIALDSGYFEWILESNKKAEEDGESRYNNDTSNAFIEFYLSTVEPSPESQHFGTVGTRINNIEATVTFIKELFDDWGSKLMVKAKTPEGHELVMFTTAGGVPCVGKKMRLNAMIAKHDEYEGVKQTQLKRPTKIAEVV